MFCKFCPGDGSVLEICCSYRQSHKKLLLEIMANKFREEEISLTNDTKHSLFHTTCEKFTVYGIIFRNLFLVEGTYIFKMLRWL